MKMHIFFRYLQLELKKTLKSIPYILIGTIVLVLFAGTIAFSAGKLLYGESKLDMIDVGVIMPENDALGQKVLQMIESLDSVESLCRFTYLDEEEGIRGLKSGKFFALLKVPSGFVESIMDGTNIPVQVVFSESMGIEAAVFRELTEAGSSTLGTAQAGIYAADHYLYTNGLSVFVPEAEEELNRIFLSYALDRSKYFDKNMVSAVGAVEIGEHFVIAAGVLVLFLFGIPAAPILQPPSKTLKQQLAREGVRREQQLMIRWLGVFTVLIIPVSIPFGVFILMGYVEGSLKNIAVYLLVVMTISIWNLMIYEICKNSISAITMLFFSTVVMMFLSGGIIPSVFLPNSVRSAGQLLPTKFLMDALKGMLTDGEGIVFAPIFLTVVFAFGIALLSGGKER